MDSNIAENIVGKPSSGPARFLSLIDNVVISVADTSTHASRHQFLSLAALVGFNWILQHNMLNQVTSTRLTGLFIKRLQGLVSLCFAVRMLCLR